MRGERRRVALARRKEARRLRRWVARGERQFGAVGSEDAVRDLVREAGLAAVVKLDG